MEVLKVCRGILQALLLPALTVSCSKVGFQISSGSPQQMEALCGSKDSPTDPGPKIIAPPRDQFIHPHITVEGTCEGTAEVELSGGGLEGIIKTACANGKFSQAITLKDGEGLKDFNARQSGINFQSNRCVYVDTTPPRILITAPLNNNIPSTTVSVIGECESGLPVELTQGVSTSMTVNCDAGKFSARFPTVGGDGPKTIVARQADAAGNTGSDEQVYNVDTLAPIVKIVTPLANAIIKNSILVIGTCESGIPVNLSGTAVATPVTTMCENGQFNATISVSNRDGVFYITAEQTDTAGNRGWDQRNVIRDTTPPAITIRSPAAGTVAANGVPLTGTCTDGLAVLINGTGASASQTVQCQAGSFNAVVTFSAGDGTKNIVASQTDGAGNVGSDNRNFIKDATAPLVEMTSPAAGSVTRSGIQLEGTCESGLIVNLSGAITPATAVCSNGQFSAALILNSPDGNKTVTASQTDAVGNTGSDSRAFVLDTTAPAITIMGPAALTVVQTGVTLTGTCTTGLNVNISGAVSTASTTTCPNGQFSSAISFSNGDGTKNIIVSQTDAAGNTGSDNRDFIKDTMAPVIQITAPASMTQAQLGLTVSGTCTTGLTVNLSGAGVASSTTTTCANGSFSSTITFSAGDGTKNVIASQTDAAGNSGSDHRDFIRNNVGPLIKITSPAQGTLTRSTIDVSGTCTGSFPVTLAGAIASSISANCSNSQFAATVTLSSPDGAKTVTASQTDAIGNVGSDSRSFTLKTSAPAITIASPAAGTITKSGLTISGTCTSGLNVVMGGAIQTPATVTCPSGTYSVNVTLSLPDGIKTVTASQTDSVGNSGTASRDFTLDTTAPVVAFTSPAADTVAQTGLTVGGTCESGLNVSLSGTGLSAATSTTCTNGQFSAAIPFSTGDGSKNIIASQTDAAGNSGSDNRNFVKDTTDPTITISSPAALTQTRSDLTIAGSCTDGLPITLGGAISPSVAVCAGGAWSALVTLLPPDGTKTVTASQTDLAGNTGTASRDFNLKTTAPVIEIAAPSANSVTHSSLTLTGTCTTGLTIQLGGNASGTSACANGSFSLNLTLPAPDGVKTISVSQTDAAGNSGSDSRDFILDTTAPLVKFTSPAAGTVAQGSLNVTGTCEAGLPVQLSGAGIGTAGPVSCASGTFSATISLSNGDGTKNIVATQTDAAGNTGSDNRNFVRDGTAPAIKIVTPAANALSRGQIKLTGSCETGLTVTILGDVAKKNLTTGCSNSKFDVDVDLASPDGIKNIVVSQIDAAGNTGSDQRSFMLDTTAPRVTITSPANGTQLTGAFTLTGACEAGLALTITGDIQAPSTTTCPTSGTYNVGLNVATGNGSKKVTASQTDGAGNTASATGNFVVTPKPTATESFLADQGEGKVDILFVDDNSASMDPEQAALGQKFPSFVQELQGLDWQAGITTTDCSAGKYGICGSLLNMTGTNSYILNSGVTGYDQVFNNTIQRPETVNCAARGDCPSGLEEPLRASIAAMDKRATNNVGFFRDSAALAIVMITDEDEQSNGPNTATKPQAVMDKVKAIWGSDKKFKSYAITVLSGDTACLKTQQDQQNGIGAYGTYPINLATATGGKSVSICAPDYSVTLQLIGQDLRKLTQAVKLSRNPVASSVQVTFTPAQSITWTVNGDTVLFNKPVPAGTKIDVTYEY